ncbi:PREDICTED: p21-activated protein kinase-interacting protein 1-like isoform X2 [Dinoponera quadriceps]|nr:PREDICTED: p21-activated protein kinase-interacting protein 1-like isoform X2 [Dinoponera quadriceps]
MPYIDSGISDPFEIIVGTYEQYLLGYKVHNIVNEYKVEKSFATHSHVASIRSVASCKHYLASAGADDVVCLYDLRNRRESGKLMLHNDTINCIAFTPGASHLFTCSKDGSIAGVRCGNWQTEKHWRQAHKGSAVNTLAVHPTGKLALSAGTDGVLRTWNLVKGRQAYAINLTPRLKHDAKNVTIVRWSPSGDKYLLAVDRKIDAYVVETAGIFGELEFASRIICVEFLSDSLIAVGFEDGQIKFCDLRTSRPTLETAAHDVRVKCIANVNDLLISASSSGEIKLWKYSRHSLDMLRSIDCGARITCLALALSYENPKQEGGSERERKVKRKSTLRLKQEVIIEDEGEEEIGDRKVKRKKKRAVEDNDVQDFERKVVAKKKEKRSSDKIEDTVDKPKRKKKLLKASEPTISNKKKRKKDNDDVVSQSGSKRIKKTDTMMKEWAVARAKRKERLPMEDTEDASPGKKKRKVNSAGEVAPKKKRKGQDGVN